MRKTRAVTGVLSTGQVAKFCHVSQGCVIKWANKGFIKCWRLPVGYRERRFEPRVVLAFLKEHGLPIPDALVKMVE
jgi:hypothetical protein